MQFLPAKRTDIKPGSVYARHEYGHSLPFQRHFRLYSPADAVRR